MPTATLPEMILEMTGGFAPCDYLKSLAQLQRFHRELAVGEREEFNRALLVLLAKPETVNPVILHLVQELHLKQARHVLLAHIYSNDFLPGNAGQGSPWTDSMRGLIALTLAHIGAPPLAPFLETTLGRYLGGARTGATLSRRIGALLLRRKPAPEAGFPLVEDGDNPRTEVTSREIAAYLQSLALVTPEVTTTYLHKAVAWDLQQQVPPPRGLTIALLTGLREAKVPEPDLQVLLSGLRGAAQQHGVEALAQGRSTFPIDTPPATNA
ncbi:MAG: hypothetical protein K1X53_00070 [Candidatus Sumerlaeaceae bacterium]|nr:hypothetical protein [Candidatus Sumerlaeaceae bacterium]